MYKNDALSFMVCMYKRDLNKMQTLEVRNNFMGHKLLERCKKLATWNVHIEHVAIFLANPL